MALLPYQLPVTAGVMFEETVNPIWPGMADIAVASLAPIDASEFAGGATPASATWTANLYETKEAFKARISADLIANGTITGISPPGALVQIYERGGFWQRNAVNRLLAS